MNELECLPDFTLAANRIDEIREAIKNGEYSALQEILLAQAVLLYKMGVEFIQKAASVEQLKYKVGCADIGIRALSQSTKMMLAMKVMGQK